MEAHQSLLGVLTVEAQDHFDLFVEQDADLYPLLLACQSETELFTSMFLFYSI